MDRYREKIIALIKEELRILEETDYPLHNVYIYRHWPYPIFLEEIKRLQKQIDGLSEQVHNLSNKQFVCPLSQESNQRSIVLKLLTGLPDRIKSERKYLEKQISAAKKLIIVDPYFFSRGGPNRIFDKESKYTDFIINLIPKSVSDLEIFHLPHPNTRIKYKFHKMIRSRQIKVHYLETNEIHDRVFIIDDEQAVLVGTSLGGYGNKLAFVLSIPKEDLENFTKELERIRLTGRSIASGELSR